jgi:hypothetical protein
MSWRARMTDGVAVNRPIKQTGHSSGGRMPCSGMVRRQGLEPRTRGLRARKCQYRPMSCGTVRCRFLLPCNGVRGPPVPGGAARCHLVSKLPSTRRSHIVWLAHHWVRYAARFGGELYCELDVESAGESFEDGQVRFRRSRIGRPRTGSSRRVRLAGPGSSRAALLVPARRGRVRTPAARLHRLRRRRVRPSAAVEVRSSQPAHSSSSSSRVCACAIHRASARRARSTFRSWRIRVFTLVPPGGVQATLSCSSPKSATSLSVPPSAAM